MAPGAMALTMVHPTSHKLMKSKHVLPLKMNEHGNYG